MASDCPLASIDLGPPVHISGNNPIELTEETIDDFTVDTRSVTVVCASGDSHTHEWTGIPIVELIDAAEVPLETTHVTVESIDEYRVAVPIREAIEGLLAYVKSGVPIGEQHPYANRFVSPVVEGARDIKGVSNIDYWILNPEDHPESLENIFPDGERFPANRMLYDE
jgi:DMSO/TMAO reductase YedYZ molybdopterin-dependent catalytic subunit